MMLLVVSLSAGLLLSGPTFVARGPSHTRLSSLKLSEECSTIAQDIVQSFVTATERGDAAAASDAAESPRGIEFLFSKNRLNVAISRAQCLAIVVGHPGLATTPVSNIHQMSLVNMYSHLSQIDEQLD